MATDRSNHLRASVPITMVATPVQAGGRRKLPRQVDSSKVKFLAFKSFSRHSACVRLPKASCGLSSLWVLSHQVTGKVQTLQTRPRQNVVPISRYQKPHDDRLYSFSVTLSLSPLQSGRNGPPRGLPILVAPLRTRRHNEVLKFTLALINCAET